MRIGLMIGPEKGPHRHKVAQLERRRESPPAELARAA